MGECDICGKEQLEEQVRALKDLIEVAKTVVSTLDLDTLLHAILVSAMHYADTPAGSVALYDHEKNDLSLHAHSGLTDDFIKMERWDVVAGGLTEQVLKAGEIFIVEDTAQTTFFTNPIAIKEGIRSLICVPLTVKNQVVGILYLDDFVPRQFDRGKLELLSILASFAALAVHNANLHSRARLMAITDGLTGLHNHRYFQQIFSQELGRARRYHHSFSLLLLDVDDFKKFNDRYGHAVGDRVLKVIGSTIHKTLRKADFAFRYGGEEFVVLLPESQRESARQVAERLREQIARDSAAVVQDTAEQGVTVSVGVACYPEDGDSREKLFGTVDRLMYRAKDIGKNRVYCREEAVV